MFSSTQKKKKKKEPRCLTFLLQSVDVVFFGALHSTFVHTTEFT